jgi:hypothetical protein
MHGLVEYGLVAMARALNVSPEYLLSARQIELVGIDFRKAPQIGMKEEKAVEAAVLDRVGRYLELEELIPGNLGDWKAPGNSEFDIAAIEEAEKAADRVRQLWALGVDPIPNMAELMEDKGIKVMAPWIYRRK